MATVKRDGTSPTNTTRYLHKDHLGSVVVITGETLTRGFTMHEHLDQVG